MITIEQIKAARALLGWNQGQLATASGLSKNAINNLERAAASPRRETLVSIQKSLEQGGVEFTEGPGVKLRGQFIRAYVFEGKDAIFRLFDDVIAALKTSGEELLASGINNPELLRAGEKRFTEFMRNCVRYRIKSRVLIKEGSTFFVGSMQRCRGVSEAVYSMMPYFIYGEKVALVLWDSSPARVVILEDKTIAESYRRQFMGLWNAGSPARADSQEQREPA